MANPKLSWDEIETRAVAFQRRWKVLLKEEDIIERSWAQKFEEELMEVFGIDKKDGVHEERVINLEGVQNYIDYLLSGVVLIEMKSPGESLITAYNQALDYARALKPVDQPELIVVSNFNKIQVSNFRTGVRYKEFSISKLKSNVRQMGYIAGYTSDVEFETDIEVNTKAAYKISGLYKELERHGYSREDIQLYLVRIVFCLFAEDTGIFEQKAFENYIKNSKEDGTDLSQRISDLFYILDTKEEERMDTISDELKGFRYINGHVFSKPLKPAFFDSKMRKELINCCNFDWSYISPAVFGAMFQGVMDEGKRRELGAHYTSEENIMKVIKPLFLDELWKEFEIKKGIKKDLEEFHEKIANIKILDPACGCGNFLIIAYRELRLLEFEVLKLLNDDSQVMLVDNNIIKTHINNFYGIEYEEFPAEIAKLSMLLMKHQLDVEVSNYFGFNIIGFPIRENASIVKGNSLRMDWNEVVDIEDLDYIIGNPPFVGTVFQTKEQKEDIQEIFGSKTKKGNLDYVACWFLKASKYAKGKRVKMGLVSTNSICQGEQVATIWKPILDLDMEILYAYRSFKWTNEAKGKAGVYCVIVGFTDKKNISKDYERKIYKEEYSEKQNENQIEIKKQNISPYLYFGKNIFVSKRSNPICDVSVMNKGSQPTDNGFLILTDEEREEIIKETPEAEEFIKKYIGAREFINKTYRWVLWLDGVSPKKYMYSKLIRERLEKIKEFRLNSTAKETRRVSVTPHLFQTIRQPKEGNYLLVPRVSSETRQYVPIGFLSSNIIASDATQIVSNATLYEFGVITSAIHMDWMRLVAGRLESRYRYSNTIVYNNFIWPDASDEDKEKIIKTASKILEVREKYSDWTFAEMYDPLIMPLDLRKAHEENDKAVEKAYGRTFKDSSERIEFLLQKYSEI